MNSEQFEAGVFVFQVAVSTAKRKVSELFDAFDDIWESEEIRLNLEHFDAELDALHYKLQRAKSLEERALLGANILKFQEKKRVYEAREAELKIQVAARSASRAS
jgi:hypothetical protein